MQTRCIIIEIMEESGIWGVIEGEGCVTERGRRDRVRRSGRGEVWHGDGNWTVKGWEEKDAATMTWLQGDWTGEGGRNRNILSEQLWVTLITEKRVTGRVSAPLNKLINQIKLNLIPNPFKWSQVEILTAELLSASAGWCLPQPPATDWFLFIWKAADSSHHISTRTRTRSLNNPCDRWSMNSVWRLRIMAGWKWRQSMQSGQGWTLVWISGGARETWGLLSQQLIDLYAEKHLIHCSEIFFSASAASHNRLKGPRSPWRPCLVSTCRTVRGAVKAAEAFAAWAGLPQFLLMKRRLYMTEAAGFIRTFH